MQNKNTPIAYIKRKNKKTKIYVRRIDPNLHLRMDMKFDRERILTVRFCFLERRTHTHIPVVGGDAHTHPRGGGQGEQVCWSKGNIMSASDNSVILFSLCICRFEIFHHEKCCKKAEIPGEKWSTQEIWARRTRHRDGETTGNLWKTSASLGPSGLRPKPWLPSQPDRRPSPALLRTSSGSLLLPLRLRGVAPHAGACSGTGTIFGRYSPVIQQFSHRATLKGEVTALQRRDKETGQSACGFGNWWRWRRQACRGRWAAVQRVGGEGHNLGADWRLRRGAEPGRPPPLLRGPALCLFRPENAAPNPG